MRELTRSLRVRLAVAGFVAAYTPALVFLVVSLFLTWSVDSQLTDRVLSDGTVELFETTNVSAGLPVKFVLFVTIGVAPLAAWFAWWWSGKAVRPVADAIELQQQLMEETSHELRTPLSILSNNAQVLLSHPDPTLEIYRQGLERSESAAKQMSETVETLLVDARGRARVLDRRAVDVSRLVKDAVDSLTTLAAQKRVNVEIVSNGPIEARIDSSSVGRAVSNLVTNAIQHSPTSSLVVTEVATDDEYVTIVVTDNGPGVELEHQTKIFDRYWQEGEGEGSGIGLALVRQIAAAHGGSITVKSPLLTGAGAEFTLKLKV